MDSKRKNAELNIFSERLAYLMKELGMTQKDVQAKTKLSQASISRYLNGDTEPKISDAQKLAQLFGVSIDRLIYGETSELAAQNPSPVGPYWGASDEAPIVSRVSAGGAHAWEDAGHDAPRIKVNCRDQNCYAVEVWGDSMETVYHAGDILVIAPNIQVGINDLVVFKVHGEDSYFKKFVGQKKGKMRFASLNPNYEVLEFLPEEVGPPEEPGRLHLVHHVIRPLKGQIF